MTLNKALQITAFLMMFISILCMEAKTEQATIAFLCSLVAYVIARVAEKG